MVNWQPEENLAVFIGNMKTKYPGITIYTIGDTSHSKDPEVSQHAPEKDGDVDACDAMPTKGVVTLDQLWDEAEELRKRKDERILYAICRDKIFSSVNFPWKWRKYSGKYHSHLHLSVNDLHDDNLTPWLKEFDVPLPNWKYKEVDGARLPEKLVYGMEDEQFDGWNHIMRVQGLLNVLERRTESLDCDGVYGAKTATKASKLFNGNGKVLDFDDLKVLHGFN